MSTIRIGSDHRLLADVEEHWVVQQVKNRQREGRAVCVQVAVRTSTLNLNLSTPACGGGGGATRAPTPAEAEIFRLWEKHKLNTDEFSGGNVVAFLKQLRHHL